MLSQFHCYRSYHSVLWSPLGERFGTLSHIKVSQKMDGCYLRDPAVASDCHWWLSPTASVGHCGLRSQPCNLPHSNTNFRMPENLTLVLKFFRTVTQIHATFNGLPGELILETNKVAVFQMLIWTVPRPYTLIWLKSHIYFRRWRHNTADIKTIQGICLCGDGFE